MKNDLVFFFVRCIRNLPIGTGRGGIGQFIARAGAMHGPEIANINTAVGIAIL